MKNLSIRNLVLGLVVCLCASAGYSARIVEDPIKVMEEAVRIKPLAVFADGCADGWNIQIKENAATARWDHLSVSIDKCGEVHVRGEGNCISNTMKKHAVQLLELQKILLSVDARYSCDHIGKLIKELEECPCSGETKHVNFPPKKHDDDSGSDTEDDGDCHDGKKSVVAHGKKK